MTVAERVDWEDAAVSAVKAHTGWRDDGSDDAWRASDAIRAWVRLLETMPIEAALRLADASMRRAL